MKTAHPERTDTSAAGSIGGARVADFVIALEHRLVRDGSPSNAELADKALIASR